MLVSGRLARLAVLFATLGVAIIGCVGGCVNLSAGTSNTSNLSASVVEDGRKLFQANCVTCHGDGGDRVPVAPLNSALFLDSRGDASLVAVITNGKGVMPAWGTSRGGPLTDIQVRSIVAYLSKYAGRASPMLLADAGKSLFADTCATCHGDSGDRVPVAPLSSKAFLDSRSDAQLVDVVAHGTGVMPAFGRRPGTTAGLSDEQVHAVAAYLRANVDSGVAERVDRGRTLYVDNCLNCHGEKGDRIPDANLASGEFLTTLGDRELARVVLDGKGQMPGLLRARNSSFDMNEVDDVKALVAYLKTWAGLPAGSFLDSTHVITAVTGSGTPTVTATSAVSSFAAPPPILTPTSAEAAPAASAASIGGAGAGGGGPPNPATLIEKGKAVFTTNCVACHGPKGDLQPTAKLNDAAWLQAQGDDTLHQAITNGKGGIMPAWGNILSSDDISAVLAYVKSNAGVGSAPTTDATPPADVDAEPTPMPSEQQLVDITTVITASAGRQLFKTYCTACHGDDGTRVPQHPLLSPSFGGAVSSKTLNNWISNGAGGSAMPAWSKARGGPLTAVQIASIVAYIKETASEGGAR